MLDINVRGPLLFAQAAIPHLTAGGRIISIGSALAERMPFPGVTAYAMDKVGATRLHARPFPRTRPPGRDGEPSEIGGIVAFLASPAADLITGASLVADGGAIA